MRDRLLLVSSFLVVLALGICGGFALSRIVAPVSVPVTETASSESVDALKQALAESIAALQEAATSLQNDVSRSGKDLSAPGPSAERVSLGSSLVEAKLSSLLTTAAATQASVNELRSAFIKSGILADPGPTMEQLLARGIERRWADITQLRVQFATNKLAVRDRLLFKSYDEILTILGPPTSLTRENLWVFRGSPEEPQSNVALKLWFQDGYVAAVEVDR